MGQAQSARTERAGGVFEKEIALRHFTPVCPQRGYRYTLAASLSTATLDRPMSMHIDGLCPFGLARYRGCWQASLAGVCHHLPFDVCDNCCTTATASGIAGVRCPDMAVAHGPLPIGVSRGRTLAFDLPSRSSTWHRLQGTRSRYVLTICCHHYKRHCAVMEH